MIKKIAILYADGTYDEINQDYFKALGNYSDSTNLPADGVVMKEIKEVLIYYTNGQFSKIIPFSETKVK